MKSTPPTLRSCLLLALGLAAVVGCGGPASTPSATPGREEGALPDPDDPPVFELTLEVEPDEDAEAYGDDIVHFTVRVRTDRPWDMMVPGPPHLQLTFVDLDTEEELEARPHPLRPEPEKRFPLSLEAGETVVAGPMPLGYFDVDPVLFRTDARYRIEIRYRPGGGAPSVLGTSEAVLVPGRELRIPEDRWETVSGAFPDPRPPSPVRLLDARGRLRRYLEWSPDVGFVPTG